MRVIEIGKKEMSSALHNIFHLKNELTHTSPGLPSRAGYIQRSRQSTFVGSTIYRRVGAGQRGPAG